MTSGRSAERHPKSTFCTTVLGSAPWSPQGFLPGVLGYRAGRTRARGGSAHDGTRRQGLWCLGHHDAAAVSAQAPQNAIWEDLHRPPSFWADRTTWGNSEGEANDAINERLVDTLARKHCPHQWWLPPGDSPRRRSLDGT